MRQQLAKGIRRDIRRAMGPTAIQTLDNHAGAIRGLQQDILALSTDHIAQKKALTGTNARLDERIRIERETADERYTLSVQHDAVIRGSFMDRLRWLLTGV